MKGEWIEKKCEEQDVERETVVDEIFFQSYLVPDNNCGWLGSSLTSESWTVPKVSIRKGKLPQYLADNECSFDKEIKEWMGE